MMFMLLMASYLKSTRKIITFVPKFVSNCKSYVIRVSLSLLSEDSTEKVEMTACN